MKTYELVHLNKKMHLSRAADLEEAQEVLNQKIAEGWTLQQIITPSDLVAGLVGVFYKEI